MRTIVVSDLHVGSAKHSDLLRRPELREPLLEAVRGADRLVILGDGVELRDRPKRDIAELAAPLFRDLGAADRLEQRLAQLRPADEVRVPCRADVQVGDDDRPHPI